MERRFEIVVLVFGIAGWVFFSSTAARGQKSKAEPAQEKVGSAGPDPAKPKGRRRQK